MGRVVLLARARCVLVCRRSPFGWWIGRGFCWRAWHPLRVLGVARVWCWCAGARRLVGGWDAVFVGELGTPYEIWALRGFGVGVPALAVWLVDGTRFLLASLAPPTGFGRCAGLVLVCRRSPFGWWMGRGFCWRAWHPLRDLGVARGWCWCAGARRLVGGWDAVFVGELGTPYEILRDFPAQGHCPGGIWSIMQAPFHDSPSRAKFFPRGAR